MRFGVYAWLCLVLFAQAAHAEPLLPWLKADKIVVVKRERSLSLYRQGELLKVYYVSLGGDPRGSKGTEGDLKTPEGSYVIEGRNPYSKFYKSLRISYPNEQDVAAARAKGEKPGSDIYIHGLSQKMEWAGKYHRFYNWTKGCIAVTNSEMDELWHAVDNGTPIYILP